MSSELEIAYGTAPDMTPYDFFYLNFVERHFSRSRRPKKIRQEILRQSLLRPTRGA